MRRVALFGGSFDPVHRGHAFIAERAQSRCELDEVVFMPCWQSPHKLGRALTGGDDRLTMLRLATRDLPWASVSSWELGRPASSYSWQTAERWRREVLAEGDALYWILGLDQWMALSRWARADYLAELVTFVVFPRDGGCPEAQDGFSAVFLPDAMAISASEIRTRCREGRSIEDEVGPEVAAYVEEKRLYREA